MNLPRNGVYENDQDWSVPRFKSQHPPSLRTPGEKYPEGLHVRQAWNAVLFDRHIERLTNEMQYRRAVGIASTPERTRRYQAGRKKNIF